MKYYSTRDNSLSRTASQAILQGISEEGGLFVPAQLPKVDPADLRGLDVTGKELQNRLDEVHITVNKNAIPNDPQKPNVTSGIRIGTPAATTRGMNEEDMRIIGQCIYRAATDFEASADDIRAQVAALMEKYPLYE